jgi:hypothetical protein
MEPTLRIDARVALARAAPRVGTIAVFYPPEGAEQEECGPVAHVVELGGGACASVLKPVGIRRWAILGAMCTCAPLPCWSVAYGAGLPIDAGG